MKYNKIRYSIFNKYTVLFVTLILAVVINSCQKFLKESPTSFFTSDNMLPSIAVGDALTAGGYRALPLWTGDAGDWGNYLPGPIEYLTGKAYTEVSAVLLWRFQTDQVSGDLLGDFSNFWANQYQGIRDCNLAISLLPGIKDYTAIQRAKALAEVRTLRAWYYFTLVRYFGDVPMNTSVITDVTKFEIPRTSLKTIYDEVIIPDLEYAVSAEAGLTDTRSTNGRITKHVARAILADVYLTCAGYPYQEVATDITKNWCVDGLWTQSAYPVNTTSAKDFLAKAKVQLDVLYNSGTYTLGTYDDLHNPSKNNTGEAVFQAQYTSGGPNTNNVPSAALPLSNQSSMFSSEYGTFIPSNSYFNSYAPSDKRIKDRQMFYFSDTKATKYDPTQGPCATFDRAYLYKYYDNNAIKVNALPGINWSYYRYADILLMLTEVNWTLNQLTPGTVADADVLKGINATRARALLTPLTTADIDLKAIMSERAYELVFENKMLWDQRRTRMCLVDGSGSFPVLQSFFGHNPTGFTYSFGPKHLLVPIGLTEIQYNSKCLQNFGYLPKQVGQ